MLEIIGICSGLVIVTSGVAYILHQRAVHKLKRDHNDNVDQAIKKALQQSRSIVRGQVAEELLPLFPEFPYNLSDCKFMGRPIDYLVFDGMSDKRDTKDGELTIVLADVKVNTARRTPIQNAIKEAIEAGRVRFETWQVVDGNIKVKK